MTGQADSGIVAIEVIIETGWTREQYQNTPQEVIDMIIARSKALQKNNNGSK